MGLFKKSPFGRGSLWCLCNLTKLAVVSFAVVFLSGCEKKISEADILIIDEAPSHFATVIIPDGEPVTLDMGVVTDQNTVIELNISNSTSTHYSLTLQPSCACLVANAGKTIDVAPHTTATKLIKYAYKNTNSSFSHYISLQKSKDDSVGLLALTGEELGVIDIPIEPCILPLGLSPIVETSFTITANYRDVENINYFVTGEDEFVQISIRGPQALQAGEMRNVALRVRVDTILLPHYFQVHILEDMYCLGMFSFTIKNPEENGGD